MMYLEGTRNFGKKVFGNPFWDGYLRGGCLKYFLFPHKLTNVQRMHVASAIVSVFITGYATLLKNCSIKNHEHSKNPLHD